MNAPEHLLPEEIAMPRDVPYFPCYAENIMAKAEYRMMNLDERGLWASMYFECWPNDTVPSDTAELAKLLGMLEELVRKALTPRVLYFFIEEDGRLYCPELRHQRETYYNKRRLQSEGGRKGADIRYGKPRQLEGQPIASSNQLSSNQVNSLKTMKMYLESESGNGAVRMGEDLLKSAAKKRFQSSS